MPSPCTALDVIEKALRLTNAVGVDQTLTADEVSDGLDAFNDLLEVWSVDNLAVYNTTNATFNTIANQSVYTIGVGGDFNVERPIFIGEPAYITYQTVSYQIREIFQEQYNAIAIKTQPNIIPQWFMYINDFPLGKMTLWPVPSQVLPITFSLNAVLAPIATAGTTITFPKGYIKAFIYGLAIELAPNYGKRVENMPSIVKTYNETLGLIKRSNSTPAIAQYDPQLLGGAYWLNYGNGYTAF